MAKNLFFYELEGRGYIFQNKKWDEAKHGFEDDMLNMAWEMWSSAKHSVKAQAVPEGFILMPKVPTERMVNATRGKHEGAPYLPYSIYEAFVEQATIEAQEQKG